MQTIIKMKTDKHHYQNFVRTLLLAILTAMPLMVAAQEPADTTQLPPASNEPEITQNDKDDDVWKKRRKFFNIGYQIGSFKPADSDGYDCTSDLGVSISTGKTWYLHKKALAGMMKFGLDATFLSISYDKMSDVNYPSNSLPDIPYAEADDIIDIGNHKLDASVGIGPSFTINPVSRLMLRVYFHYRPTYSMTIMDESFSGCYASMFDYGLSVAYNAISIGVEHRFGSGNYGIDAYTPISDVNGKVKMKTSQTSFYISFRY